MIFASIPNRSAKNPESVCVISVSFVLIELPCGIAERQTPGVGAQPRPRFGLPARLYGSVPGRPPPLRFDPPRPRPVCSCLIFVLGRCMRRIGLAVFVAAGSIAGAAALGIGDVAQRF